MRQVSSKHIVTDKRKPCVTVHHAGARWGKDKGGERIFVFTGHWRGGRLGRQAIRPFLPKPSSLPLL